MDYAPSGTAVPFPEESGDCSLWVSSSGGGLFDERHDSNRSLGAFVFGAVPTIQLLAGPRGPRISTETGVSRR